MSATTEQALVTPAQRIWNMMLDLADAQAAEVEAAARSFCACGDPKEADETFCSDRCEWLEYTDHPEALEHKGKGGF